MERRIKFVGSLTTGLENMLSSGNHADVTIVVDGSVFPCHKVVLCAMSSYFDAMFRHDMIESRGGIVTLFDVEPNIFENLLKFMYTGDVDVNPNNAEHLFRASSMLQIVCLQEHCEEFLLTQVSKTNCIGIWKIAKSYNCKKLQTFANISVLETFSEICKSDDFMNLETDEIIALVENYHLSVTNEETVCDAVRSWIKFDSSRKSDLSKILRVLRLPLTSPDYLFTFLQDGFEIDELSNEYIKDAFKYHLCPAIRAHFTSDRFIHRKMSARNDCMVIAGGLLKTLPHFQTTKDVICYSFQQEKWFYLPSIPVDPGYEFATCVQGSDVFLSGGWLKLQGMYMFKGEKNKWKVCETMIHGRCGHVMIALTHSVLVFGGRDGTIPAMTSVEEFDIRTKKWHSAGELLLGIRSMSASVVGEHVLLYGGITGNDHDSAKVQCFDTRLGIATIIGDLPFTCRLTRSVVCDDLVYIVLPDGRIITLDRLITSRQFTYSLVDLSTSVDTKDVTDDSLTDTYTEQAKFLPMPSSPMTIASSPLEKDNIIGKVTARLSGFNQHHFDAIQHSGNIFIIGGKSLDNTILRDIFVVKPTSATILSHIEMPAARWCFGCAKIVLRKEYLQNAIGVV